MSKKKIAIIHDDLYECGGAQKVVLYLAEKLGADIYTSLLSDEVAQIKPDRVAVYQLCPDAHFDKDALKRRRAFSHLDISKKYDLFILSGEDALCAARTHRPNIMYHHSVPPQLNKEFQGRKRAVQHEVVQYNDSISEKLWARAYTLKNKIYSFNLPEWMREILEKVRFFLAHPFLHDSTHDIFYRLTHKKYCADLACVDLIIANSCYTKECIARYFSFDSDVIYPPIETAEYTCQKSEGYWVSINRIHPMKRIELQLEAFRLIPDVKLFILGSTIRREYAAYYKKLYDIKPDNVTFLGVESEKKRRDLLGRAAGLIFTGECEAFGMAPVEAMASGKPVVALDEGGVGETVLSQETGLLLKDPSPKKICAAIKEISESQEKYRAACIARATLFDGKIFMKKMNAAIERVCP